MKRKLQVFLSSTFIDLKAERQAAVEAILKSGHIPAGMELFTAGDRSQMVTIRRWIDESDIYMLILGGRYGSIESESGVSYTELEYDYAIGQDKPLFSIIITEAALDAKVKIEGKAFIETDNAKMLQQFKDKVLTKTSSFFDDVKDIKLCVHESVSDYAANPALKGWVSAGDIPDIKSLQDEIAQLRTENITLAKRLSEAQATRPIQGTQSITHADLLNTLRGIEIDVPAEAAGGTGFRQNLLNLMYSCRDNLVTGVVNSYGMSPTSSFLFFNVLPKLQMHGLADSEKVPGKTFRRSFLNKSGIMLVAELERGIAKKKFEEKSVMEGKADLTEPTLKSPTAVKKKRSVRKTV